MFSIKTKMTKPLILVALILSLQACTVLGPNYQEPEVDWLKDWQPSYYGEQSIEQQSMDLQFWWKIFNDPVLNQLVETARSENISLKIAGLRIFESRAQLNIAESTLYPQLQQVNGSAFYADSKKYGGDGSQTPSLTGYQTGFSVGWELDFWGRFRRSIESADAAFFTSVTNQQDIQVLVTAQVAQTYFAYRITQGRIAIAHHNAKIQKRSYEITSNIYKNGEGSELDLQQAKTQYLATLATIPDLEISLNQNLNALSVILGQAPGHLTLSSELPEGYVLPIVAEEKFNHIPAELLIRRPDIRTAAWQVAIQSAQIGVAEAAYYPSISLFGTLGWSGDSLSASSDVGSVSFGPSFSWDVLNYGRIENNIRVQDARLQQLIEQYQNQVLQAAQEVNNATYKLIKTQEQQIILDETVIASKRALAIANIRYREGYADFQRVLDAQRIMFSQTERQWLNQGNYVATVISLYKALGGGWTSAPVETLISDDIKQTMQDRTDWGELLSSPIYQKMPDNSVQD